MMIGAPPGADSNNKDGGGRHADVLSPADIGRSTTNRMYVYGGYGNRRVIIIDAATQQHQPLRAYAATVDDRPRRHGSLGTALRRAA
jgi:hypothetical protein